MGVILSFCHFVFLSNYKARKRLVLLNREGDNDDGCHRYFDTTLALVAD